MSTLEKLVSKRKKESTRLVQANVPVSVIERMNEYRVAQELTWDEMMEILFLLALEDLGGKKRGA